MVDQAADAGNANDLPRCLMDIVVANHGTIVDALVWPLMVEVGLKFNQRQSQCRFTCNTRSYSFDFTGTMRAIFSLTSKLISDHATRS